LLKINYGTQPGFGQSRQRSNGINSICLIDGSPFFMPEFLCRSSSPIAELCEKLMKE
jgi:hypothetical protein